MLRLLPALLGVLFICLSSSSAEAAPNDRKVRDAIEAAMNQFAEDGNADEADGALMMAIALCEDACSDRLLARAWISQCAPKSSGSANTADFPAPAQSQNPCLAS